MEFKRALPSHYEGRWDDLRGLGGAGFTQPMLPHHLITALAPPLSIKPWLCIGAIMGAMLAALYWLAGCGVRGWPAYLAAVSVGLTSHTFSLIAAGHDGKIFSWPFCLLLLAAVQRGVSRASPFHFALAGYAAGVCYVLQPDLALLLTLLSVVYGLVLLIRHWPRNRGNEPVFPPPDPSQSGFTAQPETQAQRRISSGMFLGRVALGAVLAAVMLCCISISSVLFAMNVVLPDREKLAAAVGTTADAKKSKWEFSTNWSLPPKEMVEFVAPCVFGIQTGDPKGPYWGTLGRTLGWERHRRGLMNLRQHTVYLGVIQLVFAAFALVVAVRSRQPEFRVQSSQSGVSDGREAAIRSRKAGVRDLKSDFGHLISDFGSRRADTFFWGGALLIAVLLALGRNFPLYRLFYMIPYAGDLRAPVKLLHVAELSLCILFAFGLDAFLKGLGRRGSDVPVEETKSAGKRKTAKPASRRTGDRGVWRVFGFVCAGIGILLLLGLGIAASREVELARLWTGYGMAAYSDELMRLVYGALVRGSVLFFACAAAFFLGAYSSWALLPKVLPMVLMIVLATDMTSVLKRYINVWDEYERLAPRGILAGLESDKTEYRVGMPVRNGIYEPWAKYVFPKRWITILDSQDPGSLTADEKIFFQQLGRNPLRLWQVTSTKNVLGPVAALGALTNSPAAELVETFDIMSDGATQETPAGKGQQVWLRIRNVLPRAAVYPAEYMEGNAWIARLTDPTWNPLETAIVLGQPESPPPGKREPAEIVSYKPNRVEIRARSDSGGVLMLNDRYDPKWEAFVDGKPAPVLRCNGVMRGVDFPAGEHTVVFLYRPQLAYFALDATATSALAVWLLARLLSAWRRRSVQGSSGIEGD